MLAVVGDLINFKSWIDDTVVGVLVVLVGAHIISLAHKKNTKDAVSEGVVLFGGLTVVGIGTIVGALVAVETFGVHLLLSIGSA
jgi:hypothetical protein